MAACIMGSLPIIVLYAFCMDYYVSGLTAGAIQVVYIEEPSDGANAHYRYPPHW